ncbi:hypothetical protein FE257_006144 [Aspergillus nanangensis]|uniref:Uncharacterized protein n=1 Tax=Aspergillus nanangensis TaxID=2582783 RepID=A0AAD4GUX9_ASPNN|nr:hypothetical protein FE257_006144 [Aspergillus nanangensis]
MKLSPVAFLLASALPIAHGWKVTRVVTPGTTETVVAEGTQPGCYTGVFQPGDTVRLDDIQPIWRIRFFGWRFWPFYCGGVSAHCSSVNGEFKIISQISHIDISLTDPLIPLPCHWRGGLL